MNTANTKFFTNRDGNTLIKRFEGLLGLENSTIKYLDAVVGFLRASGYFALRPCLEKLDKVRILVGIDVDKYIAKANNSGQMFFGVPEEARADYMKALRQDIEQADYTEEVEKGIFRMLDDVVSGKLELRVSSDKNIHAKIYILYPQGYCEYSFGAVITGSSNLSGRGLGTTHDKQYEFNVQLTDYSDVKFAQDEFNLLWSEAKEGIIDAAAVKSVMNSTYLRRDVSPYELYIKMLMEYFSDRVLQTDANDAFDLPEGFDRYDYQTDAVVEGYQKLLRYDGFFLADVVGLGKTVIASMIAKRFCIDNGYESTKILVVYPPAVEQNWKATFHAFGLDRYARFVTNGSLDKVLDRDNYDYWNAEEYDLILVDEAHKFRTHTNSAFTLLQEICKMPRMNKGNIAGYKKKVMLITATPMNNTPADIYNEILLFQDPRCCTIDGVANLTSFFAPLVKEFKTLRNNPEYDKKAFKRLAERVRERVIKPITVRRTRADIEAVERYAKDVRKFPKVMPPVKKEYQMNDHIAALFESAMDTLVNRLTYARYQAIAYLLPEKAAGRYDNAELVSRALASIRQTGLVKRLESSFYAFKASVVKFRTANQNMINMIEADRVFIAPDLDINLMYEAGMTDDEIEYKLNDKAENNPKNAVFHAEDFKPEFIDKLRDDQRLIEEMCDAWESVTDKDDSKFDKFNDSLHHELFKTDRNPGHKLVIFSEYVDTVEYLKRRIGRDDVLIISSGNRDKQFKTVCENFDANCRTKKDDYNIIISTDVLAEGINLHRSNIIINYDTPWNSTRLMQRIGRVNRIGSVSSKIYNYVFYPSLQGDKIIRLNKISLSKIQTFHTTFGEDNQIYSQEEIVERDLDKLFDTNIQDRESERNEEVPFYEELRSLYVNSRKEYDRIARLPLRSRTGRGWRTVEGVTLKGDTLVFLKTDRRKAFFRVSDESAEELSVIDALKYFKAGKDEKPVPRIASHHRHVAKALAGFKASVTHEQNEAQILAPQSAAGLGMQVTTAANFINAFLPEIADDELRQQVVQLRSLVERGVITSIGRRLQRMHKDVGRGILTRDDALAEVASIAQRYSPYYRSAEEMGRQEESAADIILTESFN